MKHPTMSKEAFHQLVADLTTQIAGRPLDAELDRWLNTAPRRRQPRPSSS